MCKCGCNSCETKSTALVLKESKFVHTPISEGLKYHIDNKIPLSENIYRIGSKEYMKLYSEARSLYSRNKLDVSEDDKYFLTETHVGDFGMFEGKRVPLDIPMISEQMDLEDEIANEEFGMDYDQLGPNEKEWVRDEMDNMSVNENEEYYVTVNRGHGDGKRLVTSAESDYEEPRIFSKEEAKEYIKRVKSGGATPGRIASYWVSDRDMNRIDENIDTGDFLNKNKDQIELDFGPRTFRMLQIQLMKDDEAFVRDWLVANGYMESEKLPFEENLKKTIKEKLCKKGEAYRKRRMAAGEKSSAYLSGRAVKVCKGQMSGKKKKKANENTAPNHDGKAAPYGSGYKVLNIDEIAESLRDWFEKENWVRINTSGNIAGDCGTMKKDKATTRCLPKKKAQAMTKAERKATVAKKVRGSKKGKQFVSVKEQTYSGFIRNPEDPASEPFEPTGAVAQFREELRVLFGKFKGDLKNPEFIKGVAQIMINWKSLLRSQLKEATVNYDFSKEELIRVIKQLKRGASTEIGMIKAFEITLGRELTDDEIFGEKLDEAEFRGKEVSLNKPKRGGSKAYYVYVRDPKTKKVKKVSFGSGGLRAKIKNKDARNAFAKRHNCDKKKDRTKAGYWSCNLPRYAKQLGLGANMNTFW